MQMNDDISNNSDKRAKLPVKVWRVVLGLFAAPPAAVIVFLLGVFLFFGGDLAHRLFAVALVGGYGAAIGIFWAYGCALVFGVPLFFILRAMRQETLLAYAIGGLLVGGGPVLIAAIATGDVGNEVLFAALLGTAGTLVFWGIAYGHA